MTIRLRRIEPVAACDRKPEREDPENAPDKWSRASDPSLEMNCGQSDIAGGDQGRESNGRRTRSGSLTTRESR
jgi:hypothetical protein